ncbi:hypothetical protein FHS16_002609 [Paenibacillus endophyticus]|uniref:DUF7674 domain-containing protein n=1 Tax=Paenibacillus endophyticus TaxID=1294268 RepID=A0A7W5G9U6_9BACL|nr:resolvase [Paenibacillus endophyticus]MBB3152559.1 hypothetical protein [Paenibacillus endophyticus]
MSKKSEEFFKIMLDFLPSAEDEYRESIEYYGEVLETIIIERVFMPKIIKLLSEEKNINLLESIFKYFEEVSTDKDVHLKSIFSTTVLEVLGNDRSILGTAQKYMGSKTIELQIEADRDLGRRI